MLTYEFLFKSILHINETPIDYAHISLHSYLVYSPNTTVISDFSYTDVVYMQIVS